MRLDEVTAEIRPRSDWEAVDLGFAMVRRDFWRCLTVWWLAMIVPTGVAGWLLWDYPAVLLALVWWWKPAGSRMVLFELSRRLFGEKPSWKSVLREVPKVWWRRFFYRFVIARFSPWLPVNLAVDDLEGLRGKQYRLRAKQLARRGDGAVTWIYLTTDLAASWFGIGLIGVAAMLLPQGQDGPWWMAMETWSIDSPFDIPLILLRTVAICLMISMSLTDLFVIGAGFGIYVNNRTWIEGWDVELAFRRLGQRLGKIAAIVALFLCILIPSVSHAQESREAAEVITEVKAHPDFKVHKVIQWVPKSKKSSWDWGWLEWLLKGIPRDFAGFLGYSALVLIVGVLGWLIWKYRHVFFIDGGSYDETTRAPSARVVMGMEVTPESLPNDVPAAVMALWKQGKQQEALGLLYRGAISKAIELARVEIRESDTEGDCLRRVEEAGAGAHPNYFGSLTAAWMKMAYAELAPADVEVESLCGSWPFPKGGLR